MKRQKQYYTGLLDPAEPAPDEEDLPKPFYSDEFYNLIREIGIPQGHTEIRSLCWVFWVNAIMKTRREES